MTTLSANDLQRDLFQGLQREWSTATVVALQQLTPEQWQALAILAAKQQVAPLFYHRCKYHQPQVVLPPAVYTDLQAHYYRNVIKNTLFLHELGEILARCQQQALPVLVLKGAALISTVYHNRGLRVMGDIDLLLPETAVARVVDLLLARGYQTKSQIGTEITDHFTILHHLPPFIHPISHICIELHRTVAPPARFYSIDSAELWAQAQPIEVAGHPTFTLAAADLLLYTCMHATYRHLFELGARFLCDVDVLVRHYQPTLDWEQVVARAQAWHWQNGVFLALYLAKELLATPIPQATLQALRPANFNEQIIEEALFLLFSEPQLTASIDGEFAQKWTTLPWHAKVSRIVHMLFLSRRKMATYYPSAPNSFKIFLYYPVRVKDLIVSNLPRLRLLWHKETTVTDMIQRKSKLMNWLEKA